MKESPIRKAKQALLGTMLGDGSLRSHSIGTACLVLGQGVKQFDYLIWKMKLLAPLVEDYWFGKLTTKSFSKYPRYWAKTKSLRYLWHLYKDFYSNYKKIVRLNVIRRLTPLGLAIWYQDDGCLVHYKGNPWSIRLCSHSFTEEENKLLVSMFQEKYGLSFSILKQKTHGKTYFFIRSEHKSTDKFIKIVLPYMHESMKYKIHPSFQKTEHPKADDDMFRTLQECKELIRNYQSIEKQLGKFR